MDTMDIKVRIVSRRHKLSGRVGRLLGIAGTTKNGNAIYKIMVDDLITYCCGGGLVTTLA